jgi:hypothetical protein
LLLLFWLPSVLSFSMYCSTRFILSPIIIILILFFSHSSSYSSSSSSFSNHQLVGGEAQKCAFCMRDTTYILGIILYNHTNLQRLLISNFAGFIVLTSISFTLFLWRIIQTSTSL